MGLRTAMFSFILPRHGSQSSSSSSHHHPPPPPPDDSTSISSQPSILSLPSLNSTAAAPPLHHCAATLRGHSSHVSALLLHSNSLFSASLDHDIRLWSLTSPTTTPLVAAASGSAVKSMAISGDTHLITAHYDRRIRVWKLNQNQQHHHPYRLLSVLPTPTDRLIGLLSPAKYVQVRRHLRRPWVHHSDVVSAVSVSHDGALLYSASWDRALKVWRTSDFRCAESVADAHHDAINAVVAGRDGSVYTGSADSTVRVWRRAAAEGKHSLAATLEKHKSAVNALAVSEDGCVLYSGACDRSVVVWVAGGGGEGMAAAGVLRGHGGPVLCVAAVAEVVCSGSADKTVRVWKRGRGGRYSCVAVMEGHGGAVKSLAAAAPPLADGGGEYVVYSGSLDCDIKVWKLLVPPMEEEEESFDD